MCEKCEILTHQERPTTDFGSFEQELDLDFCFEVPSWTTFGALGSGQRTRSLTNFFKKHRWHRDIPGLPARETYLLR